MNINNIPWSDPKLKEWFKTIKLLSQRNSKAFKEALRKAGIKGRSLHSLRHSFALRMWVELGDIYLVKRLLGHSTVKTTEIYMKYPVNYLKEVFGQRTQIDLERAMVVLG